MPARASGTSFAPSTAAVPAHTIRVIRASMAAGMPGSRHRWRPVHDQPEAPGTLRVADVAAESSIRPALPPDCALVLKLNTPKAGEESRFGEHLDDCVGHESNAEA